jgi:outer membrane receptor protein involved in Fe transport
VDQGNAVLTGGHAFVRFEFLNGFELKACYQVVEGANRSTGEELPLMPPSRLRGDLRYEFGTRGAFERVHIEAGVRHTFAQEAAGRFEPFWQFENLPKFGFGVASTDPYTLFHIGVGTDLKLWKEPITLDVEVRNLTDEPYRDFLDTYKGYALGLGRNIKVKMTVPF